MQEQEAIDTVTGEVVPVGGIETSADVAELFAALAAAQGEIKGALKDSENPYFSSKYADLASVWDACRGPLTAHGLSVAQVPLGDDPQCMKLCTILGHKSGQWMRGTFTMKPTQATPQGMGSVLTYMRRYALAAFAGIAPEDDDGNAASAGHSKQEAQSSAQPTDKGPSREQQRDIRAKRQAEKKEAEKEPEQKQEFVPVTKATLDVIDRLAGMKLADGVHIVPPYIRGPLREAIDKGKLSEPRARATLAILEKGIDTGSWPDPPAKKDAAKS